MLFTVPLPVIVAVDLKLACCSWVLTVMFPLNGGSMGTFNLLSLRELTLKLNLYNLPSKAAPQPLCKWEVALLSAQSLTVAS